MNERDILTLFCINSFYKGSIYKRSNVKVYRWRVSRKICVEKIYNDLNGKLISNSKLNQLIKRGSKFNIESFWNLKYNFNIDTA